MTLAQKVLSATAVAAVVALLGAIGYQGFFSSEPPPQKSPPARSALPAPAQPVATLRPESPTDVRVVTETTIPTQIWDQRVALLKQLLGELPGQSLPELKLLSAADWTEIARMHELDNTADIRVALADLRAVARKKMAESLQEALRRFTAASDGQLPTEIGQLAPYLAAPADAQMLARYELTRSGKIGDPAEALLREKPDSDMILSVGLDHWHLNNDPQLPPAFGETAADAVDRAWRALGTAMGEEAKQAMAAMSSPRAIGEMVDHAMTAIEPIFGDTGAFGEAIKNAAQNYGTAHPGKTATDLGQILPFLKNSDKFVAAIQPTIAQLEYLRDHAGQLPSDPELLRPYLVKPFDASEALRIFKLKWDGEQISLNFNWDWGSK